jgi:hypothetical protein
MKFSIRDLLLVTLIVALAVGWWLDHRSLAPDARKQREEEAWIRAREEQARQGHWTR